jgi:hypothetical protein
LHFEGLVVVVASFKDLKVGCLLVGGGGEWGRLGSAGAVSMRRLGDAEGASVAAACD